MKNLIYISLFSLLMYSCGTTKNQQMTGSVATNDTVKIGNDSLDFELIVFEPGFDVWLNEQLPVEAYELGYLKSKNRRYVNEYNRRSAIPSQYANLYPQSINYDPNEDYGLQLNYMLFMYFEFFQEKYNQRL